MNHSSQLNKHCFARNIFKWRKIHWKLLHNGTFLTNYRITRSRKLDIVSNSQNVPRNPISKYFNAYYFFQTLLHNERPSFLILFYISRRIIRDQKLFRWKRDY